MAPVRIQGRRVWSARLWPNQTGSIQSLCGPLIFRISLAHIPWSMANLPLGGAAVGSSPPGPACSRVSPESHSTNGTLSVLPDTGPARSNPIKPCEPSIASRSLEPTRCRMGESPLKTKGFKVIQASFSCTANRQGIAPERRSIQPDQGESSHYPVALMGVDADQSVPERIYLNLKVN